MVAAPAAPPTVVPLSRHSVFPPQSWLCSPPVLSCCKADYDNGDRNGFGLFADMGLDISGSFLDDTQKRDEPLYALLG